MTIYMGGDAPVGSYDPAIGKVVDETDNMPELCWAGSGFHGALVALGRNRSGQDSQELDFEIADMRVRNLSPVDRKELVRLLRVCADRIEIR